MGQERGQQAARAAPPCKEKGKEHVSKPLLKCSGKKIPSQSLHTLLDLPMVFCNGSWPEMLGGFQMNLGCSQDLQTLG